MYQIIREGGSFPVMTSEQKDMIIRTGLRLRGAQKDQSLSFQTLADRSRGVLAKSQISDYEQRLCLLGIEEAPLLAQALGSVSATYLLCLD